MITLNPHDHILQQACPTVMVPRFEQMPVLDDNGHRFLVSENGLWLEVKRPWLHLTWPLAEQVKVAMPYGKLLPSLSLAFTQLPGDLITRFINDARMTLPNEFAAWITWDDLTGEFRYHTLQSAIATTAYLRLERPALAENEHLVVDIHSHGHLPAFFSPTDDRDDAGEVKLSVVIGSLGADQQPTSRLRLCANGLTLNAEIVKSMTGLRIGEC